MAQISHGLVEIVGMRTAWLLCPVGIDELLALHSATSKIKWMGFLSLL